MDAASGAGLLRLSALLLLLLGCGEPPTGEMAPTVRDSAGVVVVENGIGWSEAPRWHVASRPQIAIGATMGGGSDEFASIGGVVRLASGRFVVLDTQARELRYFNARGSHIVTVGRRGDGPAEFSRPLGLWLLRGDTIAVWDADHLRFSLFDGDGQYQTGLRSDGPLQPIGFLDRRTVASEGSTASVRPGDSEGIVTNQRVFRIVSLTGNPPIEVAALNGLQLFRFSADQSMGFTPVPFTVDPAGAAREGRLVVTVGSREEVRFFNVAGELGRIVRWDDGPQALSSSRFRSEVERRIASSAPESRGEMSRRYAAMNQPEAVPAFQAVVLSSAGDVWLEHFTADYGGWPPIKRRPSRWTVLDAHGRIKAAVELPLGFTLQQITAGGAVGVYHDELNVEFVWYLAFEGQ